MRALLWVGAYDECFHSDGLPSKTAGVAHLEDLISCVDGVRPQIDLFLLDYLHRK
ncbi:hypothetical protein TUM17387_01870 [Shewanella carassii]|uniref:Uncharacterized protein n=1 Tax=Shewanella carassii TaxID=1987584 RepID=A0ABQ1TIM8_9GAMM|nr:hypothetical protein TUM17387_01870 [Shewanella carassii]GGE94354.1 hypothetical protein GCM10011520_38310 [Shewanella carassii]